MEGLLDKCRNGNPIDLRKWTYSVSANNITPMLINKSSQLFSSHRLAHLESRNMKLCMVVFPRSCNMGFTVSDVFHFLCLFFLPHILFCQWVLVLFQSNSRKGESSGIFFDAKKVYPQSNGLYSYSRRHMNVLFPLQLYGCNFWYFDSIIYSCKT